MALAELRRHRRGTGLEAARVDATDGSDRAMLHDGTEARRAASCLLAPERGDRVLLWADGEGHRWVLAVLERHGTGAAEVSIPDRGALAVRGDELHLLARRRMSLSSLRDLELNCVSGALSLRARNLFTAVRESLVESAGERVTRLGHWFVHARTYLRLHGCETSVTADRDVRIDGDRVNLG